MTGGRRSGIPAGDDVVFIGGIPQEVTQGDVRSLLNRVVGGVQRVRFMICHKTRHHKGFGFARFTDAQSADKAIQISKKRGLRLGFGVLNLGPSNYKPDSSDESSNHDSSNSSEHMHRRPEDVPEEFDLPGLLEEDDDDAAGHAINAPALNAFSQYLKLPAPQQQPQQLPQQQQQQQHAGAPVAANAVLNGQVIHMLLPAAAQQQQQPAFASHPGAPQQPLNHQFASMTMNSQSYFLVPSSYLFPQTAPCAITQGQVPMPTV
ncbi:hypothetical protein DIPPA_27198 [Diplonema papillatum]|nr:hypothetical protein DIPPA_27198 [Diplonema papillatum]